jgi:hypothetical protein
MVRRVCPYPRRYVAICGLINAGISQLNGRKRLFNEHSLNGAHLYVLITV